MAISLNYQNLAKRYVILPLMVSLLLCASVYTLSDLLNSLRHEVANAQTINRLLAQTIMLNAKADNEANHLVDTQIKTVLAHSPQYSSIVFIPNPSAQIPQSPPITRMSLLFDDHLGLHEPVTLSPSLTSRRNASPNLLGYVNLTLNLNEVRYQWFRDALPMMTLILLLWTAILTIMLRQLRQLTQRVPSLEALSHLVIKNAPIDDQYYRLQEKTNVWLFERALVQLLNRERLQTRQIEKLEAESQLLKDDNSQHIRQNSNFQNTLTREFKLSLQRIESGIQLLTSQYVSNEQQDAVALIELGNADLHAKLNQVIQMARIEKGQATLHVAQFNPTRLISNLVEQNQPFAHEKSLSLVAKIYHADYMLEGDSQKISLILSSLLENAIKFTERGHVEITSQLQHLEKNVRWIIQVIDTGIGIDNAHINQIFKPFFQINPEVAHSSNPHTVGLFLVKKLVDVLGGDISVESRVGRGTTFALTLSLTDWKDQYERSLLQDKSIAIWQNNEQLLAINQRCKDAGAQVTTFTDTILLLDAMTIQAVDVLLISPNIAPADILGFVKQLRALEKNRRSLIVYYVASPLTPAWEETLSIEGVDYFEILVDNRQATDDYLKRIIQYLT